MAKKEKIIGESAITAMLAGLKVDQDRQDDAIDANTPYYDQSNQALAFGKQPKPRRTLRQILNELKGIQ